ncbi:Cytochrome P450 monooxygenase yanC [Fusarium culmorum]|uniref:Cytochrome P450 monooxygenase yanC n=1 Tax=Fusarium culmorum TaxID=5516 RepID=A0A2T4GFE3_FUSCU|nr:Cytochrome P450 monooxygenase yanC [Fusarium culmorum]
MTAYNNVTLSLWALFGALVLYLLTVPGRRGKHLPPGPPTLPIIGNLHQMPTRKGYLKLAEWAKQYGDMYSFKIGSTTTIVLSNRRLVKEILERRSVISAGRPAVYGLEKLQPDAPMYRISKKLLHQYFGEPAIDRSHLRIINAEATQLIRDLMVDPDNFPHHAHRYANSFTMSTTYGIRTPSHDTPHLTAITKITAQATSLIAPGRLPPVDVFPFLKLVPERFLGNWVTLCTDLGKASDNLYMSILESVIERRKTKAPRDTFADRCLDNKEYEFSLHELMYLTGAVLDAGTDTTSSVLITLIQMLCAYPDCLKRAHAEIDMVVGDERTPVWDDFAKLPYINQLMKETQRIRPATPISFPIKSPPFCFQMSPTYLTLRYLDRWEVTTQGATIIANVTGLHSDPNKFKHPGEFHPDHYEGMQKLAQGYANTADENKRDHYAYGFGRRICAGMQIAERSLFTTFSKVLWAFDISAPKDAQGRPVAMNLDPMTGYTEGTIVMPKPFKACIKVRSERRRETILREFEEVENNVFAQFDLPKIGEGI